MSAIAPSTSSARGTTSCSVGSRGDAKHAIDRGEQLGQRERQRRSTAASARCGRHARAKRLRRSSARSLEHVDDFAHLLVLEQPPHELRARIFPRLVVLAARQEHLRLDAQQPRRHLEVVGGLVERERRECARETARRCARSGCRRCRLLVANEREQQVERTGELSRARRRRCRAAFRAVESSRSRRPSPAGSNGAIRRVAAPDRATAPGSSTIASTGLARTISRRMRISNPVRSDTLVVQRPGRRQQILHHVRAVERRDRQQVEHDQARG